MLTILIGSALIYIAVLFAIAIWGENKKSFGYKLSLHPWVYALSLAIYCTSWTYYGAVGNAVNGGWSFLPILLGPTLLYIFGLPIIRKMVTISKRHNVTSIADFIASRYGKSHRMALVITLISAAAIIPYIALQLKAVGSTFDFLATTPVESKTDSFKELTIAILMAMFAIAFGTRRIDLTQYRSGMMLAIAFESLVKLLGLCAAGVFTWWIFKTQPTTELLSITRTTNWSFATWLTPEFLLQLLMAAGAILCLPRQFHVSVVDNVKTSHLDTARWLFPLYLALTAAAISAIAWFGQPLVGNSVGGEVYALEVPLQENAIWLATIVYIGGISAATAMVIIATLTLSTMFSNDVILPIWLGRSGQRMKTTGRFYSGVTTIRRIAIVVILILGWLCYHLWMANFNLVSIGLLAFSLVLQLIPALIGGLYWSRGHAQGVYLGLLTGLGVWVFHILVPLMQTGSHEHETIITFGTLYSLSANALAYVVFSYLATPSLLDKIQATAFVHPRTQKHQVSEEKAPKAHVSDLIVLLETLLGAPRAKQLLSQYQSQEQLSPQDLVTRPFIDYVERAIAGVIGAASARSLVTAALANRQLNLEEVVNFFDDTTQALKTQQSIMFSSLENLAQGISVVDQELRLVVWNKRYLELFDYPEGMVQPGRPIADLIRYNAERGECGVGEVEQLVDKRLRYMQEGSPHRFIRRRSDGRVIEMVGNPLPSGGFVTSFTDVTEHIETQQALEDANIDLEARVKSRSSEVREINRELTEEIERRRLIEQELQLAKAEAEQANASKTKFLALASHDILQPLNAARLYLSAIDEAAVTVESRPLLSKVENALDSTENLLSSLLAIAKMEQGAMLPQKKHVALKDILEPLIEEYNVLAQTSQVAFRVKTYDAVVHTDPTYLRRIVQNLLSNGMKYCEQGQVLLTVRKRQHAVEIQVWDTGPGIPEGQFTQIFESFVRLHKGSVSGVGLGLSVVKRMADQLDYPIKLRSTLGKGSCFSVTVPLGDANQLSIKRPAFTRSDALKSSMHILCVDDAQSNLDALEALLQKWGLKCIRFQQPQQAIEWAKSNAPVDGMLLDYQLGDDEIDGIELAQTLREIWQTSVPGALVTAVREPEVKQRAQSQKLAYLNKPVKPAQLKSFLKILER
ncbi:MULTISPECIES: PAS-domain containing protein [Gammaproteobacteria]|uniref:PAS domain-containing hybrid sensor histidine kinase/response regulator n=1 Tax=Gammaproteobacteria TaxID=1236 RepID=UPI000DCF9F67|nr:MULTISPECIES: PAS-domain containing protein [Gammaproteobacteria]RTE86177.1 sensor histidine kinase [Aliidiomarina sp. B3213]TCZ91529.1 sensor histidine kinase [Lysobacter sp. N42]